jgi:type II restriction enzyme
MLRLAPANTPAYDLGCPACGECFQLKSKHSAIGRKVVDSAYSSMMHALRSGRAPGLLVLRYDWASLRVSDLLLIPHFCLHEAVIEKRKPLGPSARRAGWVGCNILLDRTPTDGVIRIVRAESTRSVARVRADHDRLRTLGQKPSGTRGWTLDVLRCIRAIARAEFTLQDDYAFETELAAGHPENLHVRDKIRQQLQVLRHLGILRFQGGDRYLVLR